MTTCTRDTLERVIARYGDVLTAGSHPDQRACCINEARAVCLGLEWTDNPTMVGLPDIRPLNDGPWSSDAARTAAMIRLATAYDQWATWPPAQQRAVITAVVIGTVQHVISALPSLSDQVRAHCREAQTLKAAEAAAMAAEAAAWSAAACAAREAAMDAAMAVAMAAARAAGDARNAGDDCWDAFAAGVLARAAVAAGTAAGAAGDAGDAVLLMAVDLWITAAAGPANPTAERQEPT